MSKAQALNHAARLAAKKTNARRLYDNSPKHMRSHELRQLIMSETGLTANQANSVICSCRKGWGIHAPLHSAGLRTPAVKRLADMVALAKRVESTED